LRREEEVNQVIEWLFGKDNNGTPNRILLFHQQHVEFTDKVVVMGQSFGGTTVLGVGATNPKVQAVVSMDPWYFPHYREP